MTSEAYKKQQIRLNETATAIAKTKTETKKLQDEMDKMIKQLEVTLVHDLN